MTYKIFAQTTVFALFSIQSVQAQVPSPAAPQSTNILILGATAHLGNGQVIQNSAIAFENGKLTLVADATLIRMDLSKYAKTFDASGKQVYPGFIAPNTSLGLVEIEAARSTRDLTEVGELNPNVRALVAYNTDSEVPPTVRSNGTLLAQVVPTGGLVSGTSSVVQLDAWNWEDAAFRADDGLFCHWPEWGAPTNQEPNKNERHDQALALLDRFFSEAKAYCQNPNPKVKNLKFEAMRSVFAGTQTLYIETNAAKSIQESVLFAEKHGCKPVMIGANDAYLLPDFLKQHQVPVVLETTQRLPARDDDAIDQPFKTAALLQKAGVLFAFSADGFWRQRNLPFQAGQAVGFGLDKEAALSALTLNTAKILGIDARVGSLEIGKDATLFISEGDALDMRTCVVTAAFIQGREIDLDNKHKQLNRRFRGKYKKGK